MNLTFELTGLKTLDITDKSISSIVNRYSPRKGISFVGFTFHATCPLVNRKGMAITYATHKRSVRTAIDTLVDYEHQAEDLPTGSDTTKIIGHICDLVVEDEHLDVGNESQWIVPGIIPKEPVLTRGVMALYTRMSEVNELVESIKSGEPWFFSLEIGDATSPEIWLYDSSGYSEIIEWDSAPEELKNAALEPRETQYNGKNVAYLMGGRDGEIVYIGGAITRYPAGKEQTIDNGLKFICSYFDVPFDKHVAIYRSLTEVPNNLRTIDGVPLSLDQINWIVEVAESIEKEHDSVNGWAVAKAMFKKKHVVKNGRWVKKTSNIMNGGEDNMGEVNFFAEWTTEYINSLPDSSFAVIEGDYKTGKTKDKRCRHLPFKDKDGKVDLPHLRNAFARVNQIKPFSGPETAEELREKALRVLERYRDYLKGEKEESSLGEESFAGISPILLETREELKHFIDLIKELMGDMKENKELDKETLLKEAVASGELFTKDQVDMIVAKELMKKDRILAIQSLEIPEDKMNDMLLLALNEEIHPFSEEGQNKFMKWLDGWKSFFISKKQTASIENDEKKEFIPHSDDSGIVPPVTLKRWGSF
ncbi:MAG: hypothetical protein QXU75_06470 [Candidatus Methanomethylicaceae archaeon]